jgi:hypothetical protein
MMIVRLFDLTAHWSDTIQQFGDQAPYGRDRSEVRGCNLSFRYLKIELRLNREHEIDHIQGSQTNRTEIIIQANRSSN